MIRGHMIRVSSFRESERAISWAQEAVDHGARTMEVVKLGTCRYVARPLPPNAGPLPDEVLLVALVTPNPRRRP